MIQVVNPDTDIYDDVPDEFDSSVYLEGSEEVRNYIHEQGAVSIGAISNKFPQHVRYLMSILKQLKILGEIYYEEYRPAPTLVYAGNDKQVKQYAHTWESMSQLTWAQRVASGKTNGH